MTATVANPEQTKEVEEQENPTPAPAPAPSGGSRRASTAVKLQGTAYEDFTTDGRFQPGWDAKAKSQMIADATSGDPEKVAHAEEVLEKMDWTHFLTAKRDQIASKGTKVTPSGEKRLTGAAAKAREQKLQRESSERVTAENGNATLDETMPTETEVWIRQAKRGFFVMQGSDPVTKKDSAEDAVAAATSHFEGLGGAEANFTLDVEPRV